MSEISSVNSSPQSSGSSNIQLETSQDTLSSQNTQDAILLQIQEALENILENDATDPTQSQQMDSTSLQNSNDPSQVDPAQLDASQLDTAQIDASQAEQADSLQVDNSNQLTA